MHKIYEGKTKTVYELENGDVRLIFKDDVTGTDGEFDPGANTVGLTIQDNGLYGLAMSVYYFEKLAAAGVPTHLITADIANRSMDVAPVTFFGKGVEVISRFASTGSFMRRYGQYATEGQELPCFVEVSLKDDERGDPFISQELLAFFDILDAKEYSKLVELTRFISIFIQEDLAEKGLTLIDLKLEFGKNAAGEIILIDEISGGNMRVYRDGVSVQPIELAKLLVGTL